MSCICDLNIEQQDARKAASSHPYSKEVKGTACVHTPAHVLGLPVCLTSSSTGSAPGKEDENKKRKRVYVAVTDKKAKAQLGESSSGRRDCLPVSFSKIRSMG